jgi:selenocysteine-specific elongation factor
VDTAELTRLTGEAINPTVDHWVVDPDLLESIRGDIVEACGAAGSHGVDLASFNDRHRAVLGLGIDGITIKGDRVLAQSEAKDELSEAAVAVLARLEASPWSPPAFQLNDRGALRELERRGDAVEVGEVWFANSAVDAAVGVISGLLARNPEGFTVADARDALGITRKHAVPLLGHLDSIGVTRRRGDLRVAGPRLPARREP